MSNEEDKINSIIAYKGFDNNLRCRGMQYEVGHIFKHDGSVEACRSGLHSCEYPLDVFSYYAPSDSRFCIVEPRGEISHHVYDTKIASASLHIEAEISVHTLTKKAIEWIESRVKKDGAASNTGYQSAASNTGYQSAASNTGDQSAASNTGYRSAASNTGYRSAASNTGYQSVASNTGDQSAASNTGYRSAASNTGNRSAASNTGDSSVAIATGIESKAMASAGSAIVLCSYCDDGSLKHIKSAITGKKYYWGSVKPDTWYTLTSEGKFKEVSA